MKIYPVVGERVIHKTHGAGTVQPLFENFHPHYRELMVCFVRFDHNQTVMEVDVEALTEVKK
jgi:hypothetical protein